VPSIHDAAASLIDAAGDTITLRDALDQAA
jgi:hypothetical protein